MKIKHQNNRLKPKQIIILNMSRLKTSNKNQRLLD